MSDFQLCVKGKKFPTGKNKWLLEPKLNGVRLGCLVGKSGRTHFFLRERSINKPAHLEQALPRLPSNTFLDGEFCYGANEASSSGVLCRDIVPSFGIWYLFDILLPGDQETLFDRKKRLEAMKWKKPIELVPFYLGLDPNWFFRQSLKSGAEGIVAKYGPGLYKPGQRSSEWRKYKPPPAADTSSWEPWRLLA